MYILANSVVYIFPISVEKKTETDYISFSQGGKIFLVR